MNDNTEELLKSLEGELAPQDNTEELLSGLGLGEEVAPPSSGSNVQDVISRIDADPNASFGDKVQSGILSAIPSEGLNNYLSSFRQAENTQGILDEALADEIPDYSTAAFGANLAQSQGMQFTPEMMAVTKQQLQDSQYGKGYSTADPSARRRMRAEVKAKDYKNIAGSYDPNTLGSFFGSISGSMATDFLTLLPMGQGYKAAAISGGIQGALYETLEQIGKNDDEFDYSEIAKTSAGFAATGVFLEDVFSKVGVLLKHFRDRRQNLRVEDLMDELPSEALQDLDVSKVTNNLNEWLNSNPKFIEVVSASRTYDNLNGNTEIPASLLKWELSHLDKNGFTSPVPIQTIRVQKTPDSRRTPVKGKKREALESTPFSIIDNGYMAPSKADKIRLELEAQAKKDAATLRKGQYDGTQVPTWRESFPPQENRIGSRRATDRPGGRRTEDTKTFSETWFGPRRPPGATVGGVNALEFAADNAQALASKSSTPPTGAPRTDNMLESLGIGKTFTPDYKGKPLTREITLANQIEAEYGPQREAAAKNLGKIKERRNAKKTAAAVQRARAAAEARGETIGLEEIAEQPELAKSPVEASQAVREARAAQLTASYTSMFDQMASDFHIEGLIDDVQPMVSTWGYGQGSKIQNPAIRTMSNLANGNLDINSPLAALVMPKYGLKAELEPHSVISSIARTIAGIPSSLSKVRSFSAAGELMSDLIERAQLNFHMHRDSILLDIVKEFRATKLDMQSPENGKVIMAILRGRTKKYDHLITEDHRKVAAVIREKVFNKVAKDALSSGKWTRKQYDEAMAKSETYFPRMLDFVYLNTSEGQERFIKAFTDAKFNKEQAEHILNSYANNEAKKSGRAASYISKLEDGSYKINAELANFILTKQVRKGIAGRASNLDHDRTLPDFVDDIIEDFTVPGLFQNLKQYLDENLKDIEFAKVFGADDRYAEELAHLVGVQTGQDAHKDYARQVFFDAVGDTRSTVLQEHLNASQLQKLLVRKANLIQTWKLWKASVLNVSQGPANGLIWLYKQHYGSTTANMYKPLEIWARGMTRAIKSKYGSKELNDQFLRSGAAMETALAETLGIAYSNHSKMVDVELGKYNPLDYLNNPAKFLQLTGFRFTEDMNRRMATNMGRAYVEHALDKYAKLSKLRTPTPREKMHLKDLSDDLLELGIDVQKGTLVTDDFDRAAQMVNRIVNHSTDPGHAPRFSKSMMGSLVFKFKDFVFKQTDFLNKQVLAPMKRGDFRPAIAFLASAGVVGAPLSMVAELIAQGEVEDVDMLERYLRGVATLGSFAAYAGFVAAMSGSYQEAATAAAGPVLGDVYKLGTSAYKSAAEGTPVPLAKQAIKSFAPYHAGIPAAREYVEDMGKEYKY